jgi:hypothetical protein
MSVTIPWTHELNTPTRLKFKLSPNELACNVSRVSRSHCRPERTGITAAQWLKQSKRMNDCRRTLSFLGLKSSVAVILAIVATASGCAGWAHPRESRSRWLDGVSQADRIKLRALREMVKNDPAVRAANEKRKSANHEYHEALRAAILKRDPSLATILDQIRERREQSEKAKSD